MDKSEVNSLVNNHASKPIVCEKSPIIETAQTCNVVLKHDALNSAAKSIDQKFSFSINVSPSKTNLNDNVGVSFSDFSSFATFLSALIVAIKFFSDRKEARINAEIKQLEDKLRTLYGPLKEIREESKKLYDIFAIDLKEEYKKNNNRFRTLTYLRKNPPDSLQEYDKGILEHIIDISQKNIEFIELNGWAIESTALSTLLGKLCAHFRLMRLAADGKLIGAPDKLKDIVFPLETDGAIDNEIKKIEVHIHKLHNPKGIFSKIMSILKKRCSNPTIDFYNKNADQYYMLTNNVDMSSSYDKFRNYVTEGRILDAGCGVGRDTRYFISKGYKVQSFDLSEKMCEITNKYPFAFCTTMSFLDIDFYEEYDGIWANASLLHISEKNLPEAIKRLVRSLKIGGYMYASFKTKDNFNKNDSRKFYFHTKEKLNKIIQDEKLSLQLIDEWKQYKDNDSNKESFESYIWKRTA